MNQPAAYYDDLIFNSSRQPSMNGYFLAVSNGRFRYKRGDIGPLALPADEKEESSRWPNKSHPAKDTAFSSNVVYHAMVLRGSLTSPAATPTTTAM